MTTDSMIAQLESIVAELNRRILNTPFTPSNRLWFREVNDAIRHIEFAIEYMKWLEDTDTAKSDDGLKQYFRAPTIDELRLLGQDL